MLEHVVLQQASGQTIGSYAKQIGVTRSKMQYWVSKYKDLERTQKTESDSGLKFINLGIFDIQESIVDSIAPAESSAPAPDPLQQDNRLPQMTLTFPNGMCLKIY
jgi:hypothetical protein